MNLVVTQSIEYVRFYEANREGVRRQGRCNKLSDGVKLIIIILIFVLIHYRAGKSAKKRAEHRKKLRESLENIGFNVDRFIYDYEALNTMALDVEQKKLAYIQIEGDYRLFLDSTSYNLIDIKEILSVELIEDKTTVQQTNRTITGAVVGGLIAGGAGALVGGLIGKTESRQGKCNELLLRITVDDVTNPVKKLYFIKTKTNRDSLHFKKKYDEAFEWYQLLDKVLRRED